MKKLSRQVAWAALIQFVLIAAVVASTYFVLTLDEKFVLNPFLILAPAITVITVVDAAALVYVYQNSNDDDKVKKIKNARWIGIIITVLIAVILMSVGSSLIYRFLVIPQYFDQYISEGNAAFEERKYDEAYINFEKANKLIPSDADIVIKYAQSCVGAEKYERAMDVLGYDIILNDAQVRKFVDLYLENINARKYDALAGLEEFIRVTGDYRVRFNTLQIRNFNDNIINLLKQDPEAAIEHILKCNTAINPYEMYLSEFNNKYENAFRELNKKDPVSTAKYVEDFNNASKAYWIDAADEAYKAPKIDKVLPESGRYAKPFTVKIISGYGDEYNNFMPIGHGVNYSVNDGEYALMSEDLFVEEDAFIEFVAFNGNGEEKRKFVEYEFDTDAYDKCVEALEKAFEKSDSLEEGTEKGMVVPGSKAELNKTLNYIKKALEKEYLFAAEADSMTAEIEEALEVFEKNIVPDTDKTELAEVIEKAEELSENMKTGRKSGNYHSAAKTALNKHLASARTIYNNYIASQGEIDNAVKVLKTGISDAENSKVTYLQAQVYDNYGHVGILTVSAGWSDSSSIDLRVTTPSGRTLYPGNRTDSSYGGEMDIFNEFDYGDDYSFESCYWSDPKEGEYEVSLKTSYLYSPVTVRVEVCINGKTTVYTKYVSESYESYDVCTFEYEDLSRLYEYEEPEETEYNASTEENAVDETLAEDVVFE